MRPKVFSDSRGFFFESWNKDTFSALGIDADFVQDNQSRSIRNVLRGLHYQSGAAAQGKLVWASSGAVFDVMVDLRLDSPTFGKWDACMLTGENCERLWVPAGCAHGFLVTSDSADFCYKCTAPYHQEAERTIRWDDPELDIHWPLEPGLHPIVSTKDASGLSWAACEKYK